MRRRQMPSKTSGSVVGVPPCPVNFLEGEVRDTDDGLEKANGGVYLWMFGVSEVLPHDARTRLQKTRLHKKRYPHHPEKGPWKGLEPEEEPWESLGVAMRRCLRKSRHRKTSSMLRAVYVYGCAFWWVSAWEGPWLGLRVVVVGQRNDGT